MSEKKLIEKTLELLKETIMVKDFETNKPRPRKRVTKDDCYETLWELQELYKSNRLGIDYKTLMEELNK